MNEREIFIEALQRPSPADRRAYLELACPSDDRLRGRVEDLLAAFDQGESFLREPSAATADQRSDPCGLPVGSEPLGASIGPYKLMEQLGEGGMGIVYVAEQTVPVRRRVALKVIKPGMDTRQVIARFEAERQALAMMDHPNIAMVHDGGTTDSGRPYFVMELVRGVPITEYCDRGRLPIRERLELFALVCRAVQHAHQKGVIHRDLKPSNILVESHDGVPVPKVIDFGIAKATGGGLIDSTIYTAFAQIVGTPLYMSPEQVDLSGLDIDTRSDIYSLGVLLYELLTGTTPFDSETLKQAAFDEMRRIIREDEPPTPSTRLSTLGATQSSISAKRSSDPRHLNRLLRGELDWIVMKALEKDRKRRYETANDFAADVMRHLTDQPVEACPPSARYRLWKFARRNRAAITMATVLAAALGLATAFSSWQAVLARRAEREAVAAWAGESRQRKQVEQQRNRAVAAEKLARSNEEGSKHSHADTKAFSDFLVNDVLAVARPEGVQGGLGVDVTVARALEAAEGKLEHRFAGRPLAEATARDAIGKTWRNLAKYEQAERHLRRAVRLREQELWPNHPATLDSRNSLGVLLSQMKRYAEAITLHEENLRHQTAKLGPDHLDTLTSMNNLAAAYHQAGQLDQALPLYEQVLETQKASRGPDHIYTLRTMNNLALAYHATGRTDQALRLFKDALKMRKAALGPDHIDTLESMNGLAVAYRAEGKLDEALPLFEQALRVRKAKHLDTVDDTNNLASAYGAAGQFAKAEPLLREVLERARKQHGEASHQATSALASLGLNLLKQQKYADAEPLLRECLKICEENDPDDWTTCNTKSLLGGSLLGQKRYAEAEPLLVAGHGGMAQREETIPPNGKVCLTEAIERLVQLYDASERKDKADEWRSRLPAAKPAKPTESKSD